MPQNFIFFLGGGWIWPLKCRGTSLIALTGTSTFTLHKHRSQICIEYRTAEETGLLCRPLGHHNNTWWWGISPPGHLHIRRLQECRQSRVDATRQILLSTKTPLLKDWVVGTSQRCLTQGAEGRRCRTRDAEIQAVATWCQWNMRDSNWTSQAALRRDKYLFRASRGKRNTHTGVVFMTNKTAQRALISCEPLSSRIITAHFNTNIWRHTWLRTVEEDLRQFNLGLASGLRRAQNRTNWRTLTGTATSPTSSDWWWWL